MLRACSLLPAVMRAVVEQQCLRCVSLHFMEMNSNGASKCSLQRSPPVRPEPAIIQPDLRVLLKPVCFLFSALRCLHVWVSTHDRSSSRQKLNCQHSLKSRIKENLNLNQAAYTSRGWWGVVDWSSHPSMFRSTYLMEPCKGMLSWNLRREDTMSKSGNIVVNCFRKVSVTAKRRRFYS